jgi:hypothetical protein
VLLEAGLWALLKLGWLREGRTAAGRESKKKRESPESRGLRCGWRLWLGGGVAVFGGERRRWC